MVFNMMLETIFELINKLIDIVTNNYLLICCLYVVTLEEKLVMFIFMYSIEQL